MSEYKSLGTSAFISTLRTSIAKSFYKVNDGNIEIKQFSTKPNMFSIFLNTKLQENVRIVKKGNIYKFEKEIEK